MTENSNTGSPQPITMNATPGLAEWMAARNISLAFTARRVGKLFMAGVNTSGTLSFVERTFENASGLAVSSGSLFLSGLYQVWQFENILEPGQIRDGYDRVYLPQAAFFTGNCAAHEVAFDAKENPVFVNTRFSCLAALSTTHSFRPLWKPPFITELAPEDRCHLNGLAASPDGQIRYVTACSEENTKEGWRQRRMDGGCLIDVVQNRIILRGLSMPHSPRIHRDRIWLLNSGRGELGWADPENGSFEPVISCPGFLRGLVFVDNYAIVTISKPRSSDAFSGLPLEKTMADSGQAPVCGLLVIDLENRRIVHQLIIQGIVEELMDVAVIDNCSHPMILGVKSDEIRHTFSIAPSPEPISSNEEIPRFG